jgi:hypothetical protein
MDLSSAADELYAVPPAAFTARRDALVKQARAAGEADLARQVKALRRPTVAAWLVDRLALDGERGLEDLLALGERLREAQSRLDGALMRQLAEERNRLADDLASRAVDLGGAPSSGEAPSATSLEQAREEVVETLRAAVADPRAGLAVASGHLTKSLSYAGFGEVDITAAVAVPLGQARQRVRPPRAATQEVPPEAPADLSATRRDEAAEREERAEQARAERERAEREERERAAREAAQRRWQEAREHRDRVQERVRGLEAELRAARAELAEAVDALDRARVERDRG